MLTSAKAASYAVDTSVAVATLDAAHAAHADCLAAVHTRRPVLAGHAAFETYSVLTRMPGRLAVDAPTAADLLARVFPEVVWLDAEANTAVRNRLGTVGITGGAVYDALVGEAARVNDRTLLTRDRRAMRTYDLLGISYQMVGV